MKILIIIILCFVSMAGCCSHSSYRGQSLWQERQMEDDRRILDKFKSGEIPTGICGGCYEEVNAYTMECCPRCGADLCHKFTLNDFPEHLDRIMEVESYKEGK